MFPPGWQPGDVYKDVISAHEGGDGWFREWMALPEEHVMNRMSQGMVEEDPLWHKDCSYKEFFAESERDSLFAAINAGDEDYVRKALQLRPGQDGLYINLNIGAGHPGFKGHPEDERCLPKPPIKDTRKMKIGDKGAILLSKCLPRTGVRSLILQICRNNIGVAGAKALAAALPDVEDFKIYANGNDFRDQGCIAFAQRIQKMQSLMSLSIGFGANLITDQGNSMLAECLPDSLEFYSCMMRWNTFQQEGVPARERMWQAADALPLITRKDASQWFCLY